MGFFKRWVQRGSQDGRSANTAIMYRSGFNELEYIASRYVCPSCQNVGNKERLGHAILARMLPNGKGQVFDLSGVLCSCSFFSTFWMDITSTSSRHLSGLVPDGQLHFISGHDPLPEEARLIMEKQGDITVLQQGRTKKRSE